MLMLRVLNYVRGLMLGGLNDVRSNLIKSVEL
jgi:hypothetical protein